MKRESFRAVGEFFLSHNDLSQFEKDYVIRKVYENFYKQIYKVSATGAEELKTDAEVAAIEQLLTSKENLQSYLDSAQAFYQRWLDGKEKIFNKNATKSSFWKSLFSNLLANLIYSILLIVLFLVGKDQVTSWLASITR